MPITFLKNTLLISSLSHLMIFGLFTFSFDHNRFQTQETRLFFWGEILPKAAFNFQPGGLARGGEFIQKAGDALPRNIGFEFSAPADYSIKPQEEVPITAVKPLFIHQETAAGILPLKKDSPIMFHPLLPYHLQIYFKDRQAVHIELMFNIISFGEKNIILTKRKISSGNMEADLLSARYISHYLFIQQARFPLDTWQTVKIDLSAKND